MSRWTDSNRRFSNCTVAIPAVLLLGPTLLLPLIADDTTLLPSRNAKVVIPLLEKISTNADMHEIQRILGNPDPSSPPFFTYELDNGTRVQIYPNPPNNSLSVINVSDGSETLFKKSENLEQRANRLRVQLKLRSIVIAKFNFDEVDSEAAMEFLTEKSRELDPEQIGIEFKNLIPPVLLLPKGELHRENSGLEDVPLKGIADYICSAGKLEYRIEENSVVFFRPSSSKNSSN